MAADVPSIASAARCYDCYGATLAQGMRLVLLSQTLLILNPVAATDPQSLMSYGKCFACEGLSAADTMELALLDQIRAASGGGVGGSQNLSQVLVTGNDAGAHNAVNFGKVAVGTATPEATTAGITIESIGGGADVGFSVRATNANAYASANFLTTTPGNGLQIGLYGPASPNPDVSFLFSDIGPINLYPQGGLQMEVTTTGVHIVGALQVDGKTTSTGGIDPPYLLLDVKTREEVKAMIHEEVPPEKQTGAAMYFSDKTKKVEIYVAASDTFYDLNGQILI